MKKRTLAFMAVLALLPAILFAQNPKTVVEDFVDSLRQYKTGNKVALRKNIAQAFDFETFAKRALAQNWNKLTRSQQNTFVKKLRECIEIGAYNKAGVFYARIRGNSEITKVTKMRSGSAGVKYYVYQTMKLNYGGKLLNGTIKYQVEKIGGRFVITDFWYKVGDMKGIWLVALYRDNQFKKVFGNKKPNQALHDLLTAMDGYISENK